MRTKKIITILFSFIIIAHFSSCDVLVKKKIEPVSEVSTYPIFVFNGGQTMVHTIGTAWSDPGVLVSEVNEGDNDLANTLVVDDSEMDINTRGLYTIKYTATNSFDYELTAYRFVLVSTGGDLYDISGSYYQGFFPTDDNQMTISESDVKGFWNVGNIRDLSQTVEGYIADLGDKTYIVALALLKRKISNLQYVYLKGTAELDDTSTPNKITFYLTEVYDDGTPLGSEKTYIWNFNE